MLTLKLVRGAGNYFKPHIMIWNVKQGATPWRGQSNQSISTVVMYDVMSAARRYLSKA